MVHIARGSLVSLHLPLDFSVCCLPCLQLEYLIACGSTLGSAWGYTKMHTEKSDGAIYFHVDFEHFHDLLNK